MKTTRLYAMLGTLALAVASVACTPDDPVVKPHPKPGPETVKPDVEDPLLPAAGPEEPFTFVTNATSGASS